MRKPNVDAAITRRRPAGAPPWTDSNVHDPGVMVIGLLAFVATGLLYRSTRSPGGRSRIRAGALGAGLGAAAGALWCASSRWRR